MVSSVTGSGILTLPFSSGVILFTDFTIPSGSGILTLPFSSGILLFTENTAPFTFCNASSAFTTAVSILSLKPSAVVLAVYAVVFASFASKTASLELTRACDTVSRMSFTASSAASVDALEASNFSFTVARPSVNSCLDASAMFFAS